MKITLLENDLKSTSKSNYIEDFKNIGFDITPKSITFYAIACKGKVLIALDENNYIGIYVKGYLLGKPHALNVAWMHCDNNFRTKSEILSFIKKLSKLSVSKFKEFLITSSIFNGIDVKNINRYLTENLSESIGFTDSGDFRGDSKRIGLFDRDRNHLRSGHFLYTCDGNYNCLAVEDDGVLVYGRTELADGTVGASVIAYIDCNKNKAKTLIISLSKIIKDSKKVLEFCKKNNFKVDRDLVKDWFETINENITVIDSNNSNQIKEFKKILTQWKFDPLLKKSLIQGITMPDGKQGFYSEIFDGQVLILTNCFARDKSSEVLLFLKNKNKKGYPWNLSWLKKLSANQARSMFVRLTSIKNAKHFVEFMKKHKFTLFDTQVKEFLDTFKDK